MCQCANVGQCGQMKVLHLIGQNESLFIVIGGFVRARYKRSLEVSLGKE